MGKVFNALEKFQKEQKKRAADPQPVLLKPADRIKDKKTGEPIVDQADIVRPPEGIDPNLVALSRPHSFEAEQFKILRTNLLFPSAGKPPRSIMVTSAVPGEGKSFVATNLAASIAQNINEYVLLMDCDIRRPCVHSRFGIGEVPGLSEFLSNPEQAPLNSIMVKTDIEKLTILPGGKPPDNPAELLSSAAMQQLIHEVKERYTDRYIIVDSPPPKLTAETSAIARFVDGVMIVVGFGKTPRQDVLDLIETIGKEKILGVVVNRFDVQTPSYSKYKKYSRYYSKKIGKKG